MKLLLLTFIVTATFTAFGQTTIEGEVKEKSNNSVFPGVIVTEKGTENSVNTNQDGRFKILCASPNPTLEFSSFGFITTTSTVGDGFWTIYLEEDAEVLNQKLRMSIYTEYTSIGFNSGVNYTPIGIDVRNALASLFGVKMRTTTDLTYRTDLVNNEFINIRLQKDHLIRFQYIPQSLNLILGYNKRNISSDNDIWRSEDFTIVPELEFYSFRVLLGYGRQSFNNIETLKTNEGIVFGLGKYFQSNNILVQNAKLIGTAKKWNGYWQTEFQFNKSFDKNNFEFGLKFESIKNFRELDLLVMYRIHYY
jgi:hypothetical protein